MLGKIFQSFIYAIRGLKTVTIEERNFKLEMVGGIAAIVIAIYFDFSTTEWLFFIIAILLVLSGEIINTVVEDIMNKINPSYDPVVGKIKDMMAGYVFLTSIGALVIGIIILIKHFI
jgi:diacylglycerol kinase